MFLGNIPGTIGETSVVCLLVGAAYLLIRRVIKPVIPFTYIGTFAVLIMIYAVASGRVLILHSSQHTCAVVV